MKKRAKVAFVATVYRHLEAFHLPYMKLLQEKGYEIHAYGSLDDGKVGVLNNDVICHDIDFKRNPFDWHNLKAFLELVKSFKKEEFQLVHFHTPVASIIGRIAAKLAKVPTVMYTAHGFHFFKGAPRLHWGVYYPIEKLMSRWTDYLITINEDDFNLANKFNIRKEIYFVAGVGVDTVQFSIKKDFEIIEQKRNSLFLNENDFVILCVAELNDNKNQRQLIEAVQKLRQKYNYVKCLLVGVGESDQSLRELVDKLQLNEIIHFLGFRKDIPELLAISNVVTLLSKREGLPKALMEGLAASKPIIATDVRGCRDLVINGDNGYLVPISDVKLTVNAFQNLLDNRIKAQEMGKKSREMASKYDLQQILSEMEQIYMKALNIEK
ncbi:glycosyltransferase family 4 protein [Peribacillus frigoritolerans]|uniref:glycosyltransferase family 4 protein n=1 Tax=Peribacillus frigoritolerans TaxID=450367 RepID=UPI003D08A1EE